MTTSGCSRTRLGTQSWRKFNERKMMENLRCRDPSAETEVNERAIKSSSGKGKRKSWGGRKVCQKVFLVDL